MGTQEGEDKWMELLHLMPALEVHGPPHEDSWPKRYFLDNISLSPPMSIPMPTRPRPYIVPGPSAHRPQHARGGAPH